VWLRRVTPDFSLTNPVALAPAGATSTKTVPRLALHRDYQGGKSTAQLLAAFATDGAPLRTLLITVPEGELLEHENDCGCSPSPEQLRGFPIRGSIAQVSSQPGVVRIKQAGLAGVFSAGERDFKIAPGLVSATAAGRSFLGRVEERDGDWWLFDLRWLGPPAAGSSGRE
jgi:hypothetical protein